MLIVIAAVSIRSHAFLTLGNFEDILKDSAILLIVSIGQLLVILTGGIDLSVASTIGFSGMSVALLNHADPAIPLVVMVIIAMAIGLCLGSFNGMLVSVFSIPPIITTLGTLEHLPRFRHHPVEGQMGQRRPDERRVSGFPAGSAPRHLEHDLHRGPRLARLRCIPLSLSHRDGKSTGWEGTGLPRSTWGSTSGGSISWSSLSPGLLSGLAGYLLVAFYASAANDSASGLELQTVAACVIGGVSILGGSGTIVGVILGSVFLGIVKNALTVIRISPFWQVAIQGIVILFAIIMSTVLDRRAQAGMLKRRVL